MSQIKEEYWIMRNGEQIAIGDMTESHAKNLLRKLIRENRVIPLQSLNSDAMDEINSAFGCLEWWKE
jgi:hypothetical protein